MNLLSLENVSKTLRDEPLFMKVSLGIDLYDRIGLIGGNGRGKSTFLRLISGDLKPDTGTVASNREARISMLEQEPQFEPGTTAADALFGGRSDDVRLLNDYRACLELSRSETVTHPSSSTLGRLAELTDKMERSKGWELEHRYRSLLTELGADEMELPVEQLSGGNRKKIALARCLAADANLLILDEPTNHLDIRTIAWLERQLLSRSAGCIVVTHDRRFLDAVCTKIFEIDRQAIFCYEGSYVTFLEQKQQRSELEQAGQEKIATLLRTELKWLARGPKARTGKDRGRRQRIENLMDARIGSAHAAAEFTSTHRRLGGKILELEALQKSYGAKPVILPFTYSFRRGDRIGLIGANGTGKTTFLDLITGTIPPDSGTIDAGVHTRFGYFDQTNRPLASDNIHVMDFITRDRERITVGDRSLGAEQFLEMFGFDPSCRRSPLSRLSGGEKRRLLLLSVLQSNPNFLVLDEPTNDMDIDTLRRIESYLTGFPGCLIIASHDRAFLDRTVDYLFIFDGSGAIGGYAGSCSEYLEAFGAESLKPLSADPAPEAVESRSKQSASARAISSSKAAQPMTAELSKEQERPGETQKRTLTFRERKELEALYSSIDTLETEKDMLEKQFQQAVHDSDKLEAASRRYRELLGQLAEASGRWEFLASIDEQ